MMLPSDLALVWDPVFKKQVSRRNVQSRSYHNRTAQRIQKHAMQCSMQRAGRVVTTLGSACRHRRLHARTRAPKQTRARAPTRPTDGAPAHTVGIGGDLREGPGGILQGLCECVPEAQRGRLQGADRRQAVVGQDRSLRLACVSLHMAHDNTHLHNRSKYARARARNASCRLCRYQFW